MVFKKIIEERMKKGPILKRLRETFFKASTRILDPIDFESSLKNDIKSAQNIVIVISPFLSKSQVSKFLSFTEVADAIKRGVKLTVITRPSNKNEVGDMKEHESCIQMLKEKGIKVFKQPKLHFKSAIIDDSVVYLGSINPLSITTVSYIPPDYMIRFESEALVDEIVENVIGKERYESWLSK